MSNVHAAGHESIALTAAPAGRAPGGWLLSRAGDFWFACAGGGVALIVLALALHWYGDREFSAADILLGELHLGATYDAVIRNRLWKRMQLEVLVVPLCILAATYAMMYGGYTVWVTTAALYLAAWHRGRQNLGIARYYQVRSGGALSSWHLRLFRAAIYLPMIAGVAYFTSYSPDYEGDEYVGLWLDDEILWTFGALAAASVAAYLAFSLRNRDRVHPGERWLVIANAIAFGSAYVLGAWTVGFILVLALHHEVQYLYFTYAVARTPANRSELRFLASFAVWPLIGLASWAICKFSGLEVLVPFLVGGLLCHYWLDSRIWTARARRLASR
jgi:hypothetical protein